MYMDNSAKECFVMFTFYSHLFSTRLTVLSVLLTVQQAELTCFGWCVRQKEHFPIQTED